MPGGHGTDTEVGRLRTVLVHRPGAELSRITPGNAAAFPCGRVPWLSRAQAEHDALTGTLRDQGVDVMYLTELLQDVLEYQPARDQVAAAALDPGGDRLGESLRGQVRAHLDGLDPETLSRALITGLTRDEFRDGRGAAYQLLGPLDYLIEPLPGLMFTRDTSVWVGDRVAVASPPGPGRRRESSLVQAVYDHHPMFTGSKPLYRAGPEALDGGELLLLAPGVIAIGTGGQTSAAAVERLARSAFGAGFAHTVLAVPIAQERATMHLDTVCTMVDSDAVVMYPAIRDTLSAYAMRPDGAGGLKVDGPRPFLAAAAEAMGIDRLRVIDTGLDPVTAEREQWDDGNNTLALAPGVVVAYERNVETNDRLEAAGIEVLRISGSELGSGRGGPRCMSCPIERSPL